MTDQSPDKNIIRQVLSSLICEEDRWHLMGSNPLSEDTMPDDMEFESSVLKALLWCRETGNIPRENTVKTHLETIQNIDDAEESLAILTKYKGDPNTIRAAMSFVIEIQQGIRGQVVADQAKKIMSNPILGYSERYDKASALWSSIAPRDNSMTEYSQPALNRLFVEEQRKIVAAVKAGKQPGIQLPFRAASVFFSTLEWGTMTMLLAEEGVGKTTLLDTIGEHVAWKSKLVRPCDVVILYLEESPLSIATRQHTRTLLIPYNSIASGEIDMDSNEFKGKKTNQNAKMKKVHNKQTEFSNSKGHLHRAFAADAGIDEIVNKAYGHIMASHETGRDILLMFDYLQAIPWVGSGMNKTEAYAAFASKIDKLAKIVHKDNGCKVHVIMAAQESHTSPGEAFHTTEPRKISRLVLSLRRDGFEGEGDSAVARESKERIENGRTMFDTLGNKRYWYQIGDKFSHTGIIKIAKGNNAASGAIKIFFEGGYGKIMQQPLQVKELIASGRLKA